MPTARSILCITLCLLTATATLAQEPAEIAKQIRSPLLDPDRAVSLRNVELEIGIALLEIERGVLIPTKPINGRTIDHQLSDLLRAL